ncbi:uncharacterized protein LOC121855541 isoform X2 [Homarus americanus]|uniref:uncharacterized protein LOC121855541 isoform X2 n=1 Tax=Homarus americanus TaxID=6706 RepID=UPI001C451E6D|nr:uncharacterized protein LOC121855541 isoform X2 [Homarus americanus]
MFSKVFKVDKKCRDGGRPERPASASDHHPAYYPLLPSSLQDHRKRVTIHDTQAQSLEQDLDLLELVCRSDSLHKRLDELQAKYERVDDGMENLTSREAHIKHLRSVKTKKPASGLFNAMRTSKSFEEGENTKKPNFFKRIFGNRLSKSEDDLLDKSPPSSSVAHDEVSDSEVPPTPPPMKERRSASEDILSTHDLLLRGHEKRQSWCAEFTEREMMPPPSSADLQKSGLKRKRVIKVYNLSPLDQKDPRMGSTESCSDSTDSEMEFKSRYGSGNLRRVSSGSQRHYTHREEQPGEDCCHYANVDVIRECRPDSPDPYKHPEHINQVDGAGGSEEALVSHDSPSCITRQNSRGLRGTPKTTRGEATTSIHFRRQNDLDVERGDRRKGRADMDNVNLDKNDEDIGEVKEATIRRCVSSKGGTRSRESSPSVAAKTQTLPRVESRIRPILKHTGQSFDSEVFNIYKMGPLLSRTPSSKEVLLTRTPSTQKHSRTPSSQELSKTTHDSQDLLFSKTLSCQELSKAPSSQETGLSKAPSSQELPTRLPTKASIQELDHFLTAIIKNLELQLEAGGSVAFKPRTAGGTLEGIKRKRKKRKEDILGEENKMEALEDSPRKCKRMSECGACGRRWVEPRLLPCLHTVCTPCLHARATHITPTPSNPAQNGSSTYPSATDKSQITPTPTPRSNSRRASQEHEGGGSLVLSTAPTTCATSPTPPTMTYNGGLLSRHWNGEGSSSTHLSLGSVSSVSSSVSSTTTSRDQHTNTTTTTAITTTTDTNSQPGINANQEELPRGNQHSHREQKQQWTASTDLESVIELLTNLSPNSSCNNNPTPKVTITPTPSEGNTLSKPTPPVCSEDDALSPSSTIDSRCSSRTRSSEQSSSCESIQKSKGTWVVWCPECGYEAEVPVGGVECFPLNYVLQKQLVLEALNSSSTTVFCDLCHDDVVAEERCDTCPVNLCRLCSHAHTRQRRTTHHTVISLQEARNLGIREVAHTLVCATHGEGEVGWWCRGCNEPLCASCLATLHRGHPTVTVDQEAPQARRKLTTLLDQASSRMSDLLTTVEDLTGAATRVQQRGRVVSDQVNAFIDDYIMALEEHRHTLLRQVRQACERAQRGIVTESQRAGQTASWLRQGCDLTHDLLHHAGDAEALALAPLVTRRLQTLLGEEVRGWLRWERLALLREHRAGKVRGHRIQGVIADAPAHPASSRLKPLCDVSSLVVGSKVSALVVARDVDGQPITHGGEEVSTSVLTRDGTILCGCSVRDREDGSYEVIFSPPVPTAAALHVTIQGVHVQGSPLELTITSGVSSMAAADTNKEANLTSPGRRHTGIFHCCTFCSSGGDKTASCACGATMPGVWP